MDEVEFRIDITKKEIDILNSKINHFDNLRLKTKQMAIILWTASVGYGLKENLHILFFISTLLPIPFWLMETSYRRYYKGFHLRLWAIRNFFRNGKFKVREEVEVTLEQFLKDKDCNFPLFDFWANDTIDSWWFNKETSFYKNFFNRNLILVYGPMVIISIILICISYL